MKKRSVRKVFFCILISFILITFLLTFSTVGCGRRALLREKLKSNTEVEASQSAVAQSGNESENAKEDTGSEQDQAIAEEESTSQESASNESTSEESVSRQEEETTAEQETAEETLLEEESVDQEEEQEPISITINAVDSESGYITGEQAGSYGHILVGDDGSNNKECRGYLSYDISELSGSTISEASIDAIAADKVGTPFEQYGPIIITHIVWGTNPITLSEWDVDGVELANFKQKDFTIANEILKQDLQKAVNNGRVRYQIKLYFEMNETDGDNSGDALVYYFDSLSFNVTFIPSAGG